MGKKLFDKKQIQETIANFFTSIPVEFCLKDIEEVSDKWTQVIANNGGYIIE